MLWDTSPPSSPSAGFLNKVAIPCPKDSSLNFLACPVASGTSLDSATLSGCGQVREKATETGTQGGWGQDGDSRGSRITKERLFPEEREGGQGRSWERQVSG